MPAENWPVDTPAPAMLERVRARAARRRQHRHLRNAVVGSTLTAVLAVATVALTSTPTASSLRTTPAEERRAAEAGTGQEAAEAPPDGPPASAPGGGVRGIGGPSGLPTTVPSVPAPTGSTTTTTVPPRAVPAGDREIAFMRNDSRIWLVRADGSGEAPLTDASHRVDNPDWAPDGSRLVAVESRSDATGAWHSHLTIVGLDGALQPLTAEGRYVAPRWSPDGSRIAFTRRTSSDLSPPKFDLWVMDADGSGQRQLAGPTGSIFSWSPDGERIAFEGEGGLATIRRDGTDLRPVPSTSNHRNPVWSLDGDRLAVNILDQGRWYIATIRLDGTDRRVLTEGWFTQGMDWSPNGRTIAFGGDPASDGQGSMCMYDCPQPEPMQIRRIDVDGSNHREVTQGPTAYRPSWRPKPAR